MPVLCTEMGITFSPQKQVTLDTYYFINSQYLCYALILLALINSSENFLTYIIFSVTIFVMNMNSEGCRTPSHTECNIELSMCENILREVNSNKVKCLTLCFICGHGKRYWDNMYLSISV